MVKQNVFMKRTSTWRIVIQIESRKIKHEMEGGGGGGEIILTDIKASRTILDFWLRRGPIETPSRQLRYETLKSSRVLFISPKIRSRLSITEKSCGMKIHVFLDSFN